MPKRTVLLSIYPVTTWAVSKVIVWIGEDGRTQADVQDLGPFHNQQEATQNANVNARKHRRDNPDDKVSIRSNP